MKKIYVALLILLLISSLSFSQSRETGAITGKVTDEQGSPLPGVNLTLSGEKLMGIRATVSDTNGGFRYPALPPGTYSLKAELGGFGTVVQENVRLNTTVTLSLTLVMKAATVQEQVTVIAKSPTVDVKSTETASVTLGNEILRNIPNSQFSVDIVNLAPGVNGDVAYGAAYGRGVSWQMDGVAVGDPDYGTSWVFVDYNIIEEAKVTGIGLPAEYGNFTGVIFNIITKSGGNEFSGHFEADFQGNKSREAQGLKGVFPGGSFWGTENNADYAADWPGVTSPLEKLFDINAHLGGPIVKDKLWFFAGAQWYRSQDWVTGFPLAQDYKQPRLFLKLSSQFSAKTNASAAVEWDNYKGTYRGASARVTPDATRDQIDPETVLNFNLTHIFSAKTFFDFKFASFSGYYNLEPRTGRDVYMHYFLDDNPDIPGDQSRWKYYNWGGYAEHPRSRLQANASATHYAENFIKGSHDFKFGVEFEHSRVRNLFSYTGATHTRYYDYWGPSYYEGYPYAGNYSAYQYEGYNARTRITRLEGFVQDGWQISKRLNVSFGIRLSQNWGKQAEAASNQWSTFRVAPRLGFTFDLLGDKTTILKAHYGEFTEGMYASFLDRLSPTFSDWILKYWNPLTEEWNESYRVVHGTWVIDGGIKHPFMRQFTVGFEREVFKDASFSVTYINRTYHNPVTAYNRLATYEAVPYHIDDDIPGAVSRDFTLYNLTSGDAAEWHIANIETIAGLYQDSIGLTMNPYHKYWGLEFLFNKRFSSKWQMMASYVYSRTTGTLDNTGAADDLGWNDWGDPNYWINRAGRLTADPTHMIKVQGTYALPLGISFNAYFHGITGDAWAQQFRLRRFLDQGTVTFNTEPSGSHHYKMAKSLDVRLEKTFTLASKYRLGLMFDVFNVFNDDSITSWGTTIDYSWYADGSAPSTLGHDLDGLVLPRRARVGIRLIF
ncbi:MAG: carboxypeptidase regulatory-like domain-containing protein [Candidatus Aminicenantales bacterium]